MKLASALKELKETVGEKWIPEIYRNKVRVLRTRSYVLDIPAKENDAEILHTLLGIELKVGRKRLACPDLSTARYLRVFARLGASEIAVPYDISKIAALADKLESAWQYTLLMLEEKLRRENSGEEKSPAQKRARSAAIKLMRQELLETGAGSAVPEFKQTTKQQKYQKNKL